MSVVFVHTELNVKTVLFQTIKFSASRISMSKTVLLQSIQFRISTQFSYIGPIDRTLSGGSTSGQNGPGSDGNEGVLRIPQSYWNNIIRSFSAILLVVSNPSTEKQSV